MLSKEPQSHLVQCLKNKGNEMKEKELGRKVDQYSTQHLRMGEGKVIQLGQSYEALGKCSKGHIG